MTDRYAEICRSHWRKYESDDEHAERVERCTKIANEYFAPAVASALDACHQTLRDIDPYKDSPRWRRMKEAAESKYREDTAPAYELFLDTFDELMRDGEISEATGDKWDALERNRADSKQLEEV